MAGQRSEKVHRLTMAVLMLAMGVVKIVLAIGGSPTWLPPLNFGICAVAYTVLLAVETLEENDFIRGSVDALSHVFGVLTLAALVGIVSIEFALGLLFSIVVVSSWYFLKQHLGTNNTPAPPAVNSRSEKIHLLILSSLGGAIVFGQIAISIGMRRTSLPLTFFGVSALSYMFFRWIELLENHAQVKIVADYLSQFAGFLSLVSFVGLISLDFALGILITGFVVGMMLICRYYCTKWWSQPTAQELADEVQSLLVEDEYV